MMHIAMHRSLLYPALLLLAALLLIGCGRQTKRESPVLNATRTPVETTMPVLVSKESLEDRQTSTATSTPRAKSTSEANPSASSFDSPIDPGSQEIVLLPTVTPTSVLYFPTGVPERHPMTTPYYYGGEGHIEHAQRGITDTVRTGAGFGRFSFNDVSPCLCQSLQNSQECSREIEEYLLSAHMEGIVRREQCLSIELGDDRIVTFNDLSATAGSVRYTYAEPLPDINYHLLRIGYWEGGEYLLVDGNSGAVTVVPGYPVFSPDHRHFAIGFFPMGSLGSTLLVQVWNFGDDGPHFEKGWRIERLPNIMPTFGIVRIPVPIPTWARAERFHIRWPLSADPQPSVEMMVELEANGWEIYYNDKPIVQPIVEAGTIQFATMGPASEDFLDTLEAGKLVYTDRDYVFTSVPDKLAGAIYFRLPQAYYLGEEPSYFPLEAQMANYLQFQVNDCTSVYVALDAQVRKLPDWMQSGWEAVEISLETDDVPLQLYRKVVEAGDMVELVDKWMMEDRVPSQFVVIVKSHFDSDALARQVVTQCPVQTPVTD